MDSNIIHNLPHPLFPSENLLCHSNVLAPHQAPSPYALRMNLQVSVPVFFNFTKKSLCIIQFA